MFELEKTDYVEHLIEITKSHSGISGPELAKAHMQLGKLMAAHIPYPPEETTIVAILRGGIFFAEGIYLELGCKFELYNPKYQKFIRPQTKYVVLVDSVINTGNTLKSIMGKDMAVSCCVINENAVPYFKDRLFTVRISNNSYIGKNIKEQVGNVGPDTTMRLFNQI